MTTNNAAMVENGPFLEIRPDQWQAHLDLNLMGISLLVDGGASLPRRDWRCG